MNGDDPEAVVHVAKIATEFRQQFQKPCRHRHVLLPPLRPQRRRRAGVHAAADVPRDPQRTASAVEIYGERLVEEGVIAPRTRSTTCKAELPCRISTRSCEAADGYKPNKADWLDGRWSEDGLADGRGPPRRDRRRRSRR